MAFHAIKAGEGDVFLSAGVETVSRYARGNSDVLPPEAQALVGGPWQNPRFADAHARSKTREGEGAPTWTDPREDGALPDVYLAMGQTAENLAQVYNVTREEMDEFGVRSQNLAEKAIADGFWAREITPVTLPDGTTVSADDGPRRASRWRAWPGSSRCSAPTAASPPATAARSTTAPPRSSS
jgi:acetyl-CoA C-acetyltransferase